MSKRNPEFLHGTILGDAVLLDARSFSTVTTGALSVPTYRSKYFETVPSVWASAYTFTKLLKRENASAAESFAAVGEWISMFALHFLGVAHVAELSRNEIIAKCDPDFWPAVAGTYPALGAAGLESLRLLRLDDETALGGYYPECIFFPARGRESWRDHPRLAPLLEQGRLSWEKVGALLDGAAVRQFEIHLRSIAESCLTHEVQQTLIAFCDQQFGTGNVHRRDLQQLPLNPGEWPLPALGGAESQTSLLERYPLKQPNAAGGTTYYLVAGLDKARTPWLHTPIGTHLPAPADFRKTAEQQISVDFAGRTHELAVGENDRIVLLSSLLLDCAPYWTRYPKNAGDFAAKVRSFHRIEPPAAGATGIFAGTLDETTIVCLAPVSTKFVREFPSVLNDDKAITAKYDRAADVVHWTITVLGVTLQWSTSAVFSKALASSSVALWPARSSPDWRIYAAKGTGTKQSYGRWVLVDEMGETAQSSVDIEEDEYVTLLHNEKRSCQPRALLLNDANGRERGLLMLAPLQRAAANPEHRPAMAVDFGTSNTCLAARAASGEPATLTFDQSPLMVWGKAFPAETPGFVPFRWGGKRGYYPSILLSLIHAKELSAGIAELRPEHLFQVDIPSLHDQLDGIFLGGQLSSTWSVHANLKWEQDPRAPWRSLFLGLSLLYAHAELFMRDGAVPSSYVFTFPLAFSEHKRKAFHEDNRSILAAIRRICFGGATAAFDYIDSVDESRAIAKSAQAASNPGVLEVFLDVGGGTADVAIRHANEFLVLDSIRLAGKAFFHFTERNLRKQLLASDYTLNNLVKFNLNTLADRGLDRLTQMNLDLGTAYCVSMNGLDEATFRKREGAILDGGTAPERSYQRYRSQLFFRHLLAYALLQACAAAADHKISLADGGVTVICSGNAWGLLVFAHLHRSRAEIRAEAERILESVKEELIATVTQDEAAYINSMKMFSVNLMNEHDLRDAKTSVAIGALRAAAAAGGPREDRGSTSPYVGFTMNNVVVNDAKLGDVRWCSRWTKAGFAGRANADLIRRFTFDPSSAGVPVAPILRLFTKIANTTNRKVDQLAPENWGAVNGAIRDAYVHRVELDRPPMNYFVADVLYPEDDEHVILDELARINDSFSSSGSSPR